MTGMGQARHDSSLGQPFPRRLFIRLRPRRCSDAARRFVPITTFGTATSSVSFDHLVGEREQRRRDGDAERLGRLAIEHKLDFGGPHDRQIARFLAIENPPGVYADLAVGIGNAGPVAHQAAKLQPTHAAHSSPAAHAEQPAR
jgi:hypothetical protein